MLLILPSESSAASAEMLGSVVIMFHLKWQTLGHQEEAYPVSMAGWLTWFCVLVTLICKIDCQYAKLLSSCGILPLSPQQELFSLTHCAQHPVPRPIIPLINSFLYLLLFISTAASTVMMLCIVQSRSKLEQYFVRLYSLNPYLSSAVTTDTVLQHPSSK